MSTNESAQGWLGQPTHAPPANWKANQIAFGITTGIGTHTQLPMQPCRPCKVTPETATLAFVQTAHFGWHRRVRCWARTGCGWSKGIGMLQYRFLWCFKCDPLCRVLFLVAQRMHAHRKEPCHQYVLLQGLSTFDAHAN